MRKIISVVSMFFLGGVANAQTVVSAPATSVPEAVQRCFGNGILAFCQMVSCKDEIVRDDPRCRPVVVVVVVIQDR